MALVTGASRGIGKAIADALAEGGVSHLLCVARQQVRKAAEEEREGRTGRLSTLSESRKKRHRGVRSVSLNTSHVILHLLLSSLSLWRVFLLLANSS